jgi:hypothetical protein
VNYPGPDHFPADDIARLSRVIEAHRARLKNPLGFIVLATFPAPTLPTDLTARLGPTGELQLDLDYEALLVAIPSTAGRG